MDSCQLDLFPCLLLVTEEMTHTIVSVNKPEFEFITVSTDELIGKNISVMMTNGTLIFIESYIRPAIMNCGFCSEVQITLLDDANKKIPAVTNVKRSGNNLYWAIYPCVQRDKLYQELLDTRDKLQQKTEELVKVARLDPLTGLLNRRAAMDSLDTIMKQISRKFTPLCFLMLDIDHFKYINDTYGHVNGDKILIELSNLLKHSCRDSDIVSRWGGEEFLLILYNSPLAATQNFCDELHDKISEIKISGEEYLTVSIGASQVKEEQLQLSNMQESLIIEADMALYRAKRNGRNCSVIGQI